MTNTMQLLSYLADGQFHSGEILASHLGVTRSAIWKRLKKVEAMGLSVDAVRGRGYRLRQPLEFLDIERIRQLLPDSCNAQMNNLVLFDCIDSTNGYLMRESLSSKGAHVCLAEMQSGGQGRRGRHWVSPFASNIYMSVKWQYDTDPVSLSGLSLALGVGLMRVLTAAGCDDIGLKWPNDIICQGKKIAGILLELKGDVNSSCHVVAGVGVNVRMPEQADSAIDQPWTDLYRILGMELPGRNKLAAGVIKAWFDVFHDYPVRGFSPYQQEWNQWDIVRERQVTLSTSSYDIEGIAKGVNHEGALLLKVDNTIEAYHAGEISLRITQ